MENKKDKCIDVIVNITENVKPEFLAKIKRKHPTFILVEIQKDKKFGAVAKIYERNSIFDRFDETLTEVQRKKMQKKSKEIDWNKPVDTSNWVNPDEESIRNALIKSLFYLTIFKEDSNMWQEEFGKARAFYSILHSHSPKNPQALSNFEIGNLGDNYFETIVKEFKDTSAYKKYKKSINYLIKEKDINKVRANYKKFKEECLNGMIKIDPNPPKFKDYLSSTTKKKSLKR